MATCANVKMEEIRSCGQDALCPVNRDLWPDGYSNGQMDKDGRG